MCSCETDWWYFPVALWYRSRNGSSSRSALSNCLQDLSALIFVLTEVWKRLITIIIIIIIADCLWNYLCNTCMHSRACPYVWLFLCYDVMFPINKKRPLHSYDAYSTLFDTVESWEVYIQLSKRSQSLSLPCMHNPGSTPYSAMIDTGNVHTIANSHAVKVENHL